MPRDGGLAAAARDKIWSQQAGDLYLPVLCAEDICVISGTHSRSQGGSKARTTLEHAREDRRPQIQS